MGRKRRCRWTATLTDGTRKYHLAYSETEIRAHYGDRVKTVTKGDARIAERNAQIKSKGGFLVDKVALRKATEELGLRHEVRVRTNSRVGTTLGRHRFYGHYHDIMLKGYLTPEQASATLWHELAHARQAERAGSAHAWNKEVRKQRRCSYKQRPIEIEANKLADEKREQVLCV